MTDTIVTPTTRTDAALRIVEDVVVVGGTAIGTWLSTHSASDTAAAVTAAPIVRSGIAQALTNRRVSGILAALKLVYGSIEEMNAARPAPAHAATLTTSGTVTIGGSTYTGVLPVAPGATGDATSAASGQPAHADDLTAALAAIDAAGVTDDEAEPAPAAPPV